MNPKLKTVAVILGLVASLLLVSQLAMGLLIVNGGGSFNLNKLIKSHQHSGYATVSVALAYVVLSLAAILSTPARKPGRDD